MIYCSPSLLTATFERNIHKSLIQLTIQDDNILTGNMLECPQILRTIHLFLRAAKLGVIQFHKHNTGLHIQLL